MNLFLIGYRCAGKSSVGRSLSTRLGRPFVDTDALLVSERGMSIKEIVDTYGWEVFRQIEHATVKLVCSIDRRVVATGGGVVLNADNVKLMKEGGRIVWLRATPETIKKRMKRDTDTREFRPALTSKGRISETEETLFAREPFYKRAMDFFVDTDDRPIDVITDTIIKNLIALDPGDIRI